MTDQEVKNVIVHVLEDEMDMDEEELDELATVIADALRDKFDEIEETPARD